MRYVNIEQAIMFHDEQIKYAGGLSGIRDYNSLCSALDAPKAALFGMEMYPTVYEKAAVYLFHLISNHPFNDANKRSACAVTIAFLKLNGAQLSLSKEELESLAVEIASNKTTKDNVILQMQSSITH